MREMVYCPSYSAVSLERNTIIWFRQ